MADIWIYTAPIHSGKTTRLRQWCSKFAEKGGFLTPDIDGWRVMQDLKSGIIMPFQVDYQNENVCIIGQYNFLNETFAFGRKLLKQCMEAEAELMIVDEIGRLELGGNGYEPDLSHFIEHHKKLEKSSVLILVVRDYLLPDVIKHYGLENAFIKQHADFEK